MEIVAVNGRRFNGDILKVSASTSIGADLDYYNSRKIEVDDQKDRHGSGAMLLALSEAYQVFQNSGKASDAGATKK